MDREPRFDLFLTIEPRGHAPSSREDELWKAASSVPGFAGLELPLEDCRRVLAALRKAGGHGLVFDARYRTPLVTPDAAKPIAEHHLGLVRGSTTDHYGPLEGPEDGGAWWAFETPNLTGQEKGMIPGVLTIAIDKRDGHVLTEDERKQIIRMSILD